MPKKVLVIADLHCGSNVGLTPPDYHNKVIGNEEVVEALWYEYVDMVEKYKPINILIVNGDCLDGKSSRSADGDAWTTNIRTQLKMASECIGIVGADKIIMTYGTPYHVGVDDNWEEHLADEFGAEIRDHFFAEIDGVNFSIKHKIGGSSIPHGRHTAIARERLWDREWAFTKNQHPASQVLIRSHVHYFGYAGGDGWMGLTTPSLQGLGSQYGARMCSGTVDFGVVWFVCNNGDITKWGWDISLPEIQREEVKKL